MPQTDPCSRDLASVDVERTDAETGGMRDEAAESDATSAAGDLEVAAAAVRRWGATSDEYEGLWLEPREATVGVGIKVDRDDEAVRALLQDAVPASVRIRVRLVSAGWIRLRQLQVHVDEYLKDSEIWGRTAAIVSAPWDTRGSCRPTLTRTSSADRSLIALTH